MVFRLKDRFLDRPRFLGAYIVGCGPGLYTIFRPYVPHTLNYTELKFQTGAMKSHFATIFCLQFCPFLGLFGPRKRFDPDPDPENIKGLHVS